MSQTNQSLFALRKAAWRHRLSHWSPKNHIGLWLGLLLLVGIVLAFGHANVASLMTPPADTSLPSKFQPRSNLVAGSRALEIAFWLTALASTLSSFRIMELLFRRKDVRQLQYLPLPIQTYFIDRLIYGVAEVVGLSALTSLIFVPLLWTGNLWVGLACILMCFSGLLATFCVGFGVQLYAGDREYGHYAIADEHEPAMAAGQLFIFAPGMALMFSMILNLFLKLGLGEVVRLSRFARPTMLALGLTAACCVAGLFAGFIYFRKCYFRILAGFREADFVGFQVQVEYQTSIFDQQTRWSQLVRPRARGLYQRHRLQFSRRHLLMRYMYGFGWFIFGIAIWQLDQSALPHWGAIGVIYLVLATLVHPWSRITKPGLATPEIHALPINPQDEQSALAWFTLRETLFFGAPMVLVFGGLRLIQALRAGTPITQDLIMMIITGGLGLIAIHGVQLVARRLSTMAAFGIISATLSALLVLGAAYASPLIGLIVSAVLAAATLFYHFTRLSSMTRTSP